MTFNGTTLTANTLSLTNALSVPNGGTGLTSFTANGVVYASSTSVLATATGLTWNGSALSVTGSISSTTGIFNQAASGNQVIQNYTNGGASGLGMWAGGVPVIFSTGQLLFAPGATLASGSFPSAYTNSIAMGAGGYLVLNGTSQTSGAILTVNGGSYLNGTTTSTGVVSATPITNGILRIVGTGTNPATGSGGGLLFAQQGSDGSYANYASIYGVRTNNAANNAVDTVIATGSPLDSSALSERLRITTAGGIAFGGAANYGTSGQVLQSNGNAAPTWINQSSIAAGTATDSTKLPLAGGTMTGNILFGDSGLTKRGIEGTVGANDYWFVGGGATATNSGWMEIATGDDAQTAGTAEPIMASQYGPGDPLTGTLVSRAFLATRNSNTTFPNNFGIGFNKTTAPYSETEPSAKLHVTTAAGLAAGIPATSGTTFNGIARFQPNNATYGETLDFGMNVSSSYGWIQATNYTNLAVNYPLLLNPNGGNVGIGTTAPVAKLHVVGSVATGLGTLPTGSVIVQDQTGANNFYTFRNTADNGTYSGIVMQDNNVGGFVVYGNANGAGDMLYVAGYGGGQLMYGATDSPLPSGRTAMLTWSSSGVDINNGTSHLGYTLGVNGSAYASSGMYTGNGYGYGGYNGSSVINQQLPNTGGSAQWIFLGTWSNAGQGGAKLRIRIAISQGYNAAIGQDATYEIYFKTSNGSSAQSGSTGNFYGDGYCYRSGFANAIPTIQIVQIDGNTYSVYAYTNNFSGSPVASIEISQGNWTSSYSFSSPSGNYITLAQYLTIDTSNISNYSAWTSYTPSTSGFSSISISSAAYQQMGNTVFFNVYFTTSGGTGIISLPSSPAVHMGAMWYYQAGVGTAPTDYGAVHLNTNGYMYMSGLDSNGQGPGYYFYITGFYHV